MAEKPYYHEEFSVLSPPGLVSILIPCCGMLEYTKLCVPSVLRNTRDPFELIFIDIGSLDGTAEYLAGVRTAAKMRIEIVRTPTDLGIPVAIKEALRQARGEYFCLLNNDTIVPPGWLGQMLTLAGRSTALGLVGPMSNFAAEAQLVHPVPYRFGPRKAKRLESQVEVTQSLVDTEEVEAFALDFAKKKKGDWLQTERLGGFCLLVKRAVLERVGRKLDEWTDLDLFDSDILSSKALEAGFTVACCRDVFVHHFGTRTFAHAAVTENR